MPVVFISHTTADHRDFELAHRLADALGQCGAEVWIAPESIPAGVRWERELVAGILEKSTHFLVIVSHASRGSKWVHQEIDLARSRLERDPAFRVLQLITGKLREPLPGFQRVPYHGDFTTQMAAVLEAVGIEPRGLEARRLPLSLPEVSSVPASALDSGWLVYTKNTSVLVGRDAELDQLSGFWRAGTPFLWWAVEGPGGVGKSRLALESLRRLDEEWYAGFIRPAELAAFDWQHWNPDQPVAIVIDDAATVPVEALESAIGGLQRRAGRFRCKVRMLLVERAIEGQEWWDTLCAKGLDERAERIAGLHSNKPLALGRLERSTQRAALESFLAGAPHQPPAPLPEPGDPFWDHLDTLSDRGRPLFIGLAAAALTDLGIEGLRRWNIADLLEHVHDRDARAWIRLCPEQRLRDHALDVVAVATASGGFDFVRSENRIVGHLKKSGLLPDDEPRLWEAIATLTNGRTCAIEPDVLGEYFLTRAWSRPIGPAGPVVRKLLCAWDLATVRCAETFARTVFDFPEADAPRWWIDVLLRERLAQSRLPLLTLLEKAAVAQARAGQLDRMGDLLDIFAELDRRTGTEWDQLHNHLATVCRTAVTAYGEAARWPEMRRWLEHARRLAARFPSHINLQFDLVVTAVAAIECSGPSHRWEDIDVALAAMHDVARRHPRINAENLAIGLTRAIGFFLEEKRVDSVDRALAMLVVLERISKENPQIAWYLALSAYHAVMVYGARGQVGHIHWAFHILEDVAGPYAAEARFSRLVADVLGRVELGSPALQAEFAAARLAKRTVEEIRSSAAPRDASKIDEQVGQLRALADENAPNWMLRAYLARGLAVALQAHAPDEPSQRVPALLTELRDVVGTIPECATPLESLASGLAGALATPRPGTLDAMQELLTELRNVVKLIRADFPAYPVGSLLSRGLRAALACHVHAGEAELPMELLDELVQETFRSADVGLARDLADSLLKVIISLADSGRSDGLELIGTRLFELMRVGDDEVDLRLAQGVIGIVSALDRAGRPADAGSMLLRAGGLEERLEESETPSPEVARALAELRQLGQKYAV